MSIFFTSRPSSKLLTQFEKLGLAKISSRWHWQLAVTGTSLPWIFTERDIWRKNKERNGLLGKYLNALNMGFLNPAIRYSVFVFVSTVLYHCISIYVFCWTNIRDLSLFECTEYRITMCGHAAGIESLSAKKFSSPSIGLFVDTSYLSFFGISGTVL